MLLQNIGKNRILLLFEGCMEYVSAITLNTLKTHSKQYKELLSSYKISRINKTQSILSIGGGFIGLASASTGLFWRSVRYPLEVFEGIFLRTKGNFLTP